MEISADDFRRRYAELSDEGLLAIDRNELTQIARDCYDHEVAGRHLQEESAPVGEAAPPGAVEPEADPQEGMAELAKCTSMEEAAFYRDLLRQAGIGASIPGRNAFSVNWGGVSSAMEVPLMVPESQLAEATEILEASISDEDLAAQAEAAAPKDTEPEEEDIDPE